MKIAYIIDHLRSDGTQRFLCQLVVGLAKRGHEQTVICLNDSYDELLVATLCSSPAKVEIIGKKKLILGIGLLPIKIRLTLNSFDAVVTLLLFSDIFGRTAAHWCHVPLVVSSIRARNINYSGVQRYLVRQTMRWSDKIVLNSKQIFDYAVYKEGVPPEKAIIISNGINVDQYINLANRSGICNELGIGQEAILIGSVGRLEYQKGFDILLAALTKLERCDIHLILLGTGTAERALREKVISLGISRQVHFTGYRQDVPRFLTALDLYVQPSRFEGMPNALMEAMAAGCPVIASDIDGIRDLIIDEKMGWKIEKENEDILAQTIQTALLNQEEARQRGCQAQNWIRENFSVSKMVDEWEKVLLSSRKQA